MAKYRALKKLAEFNPGDLVPEERALIWQSMYDEPCVEVIEEEVGRKVLLAESYSVEDVKKAKSVGRKKR